jgi:hypothetical protein
MTSVSAPVSAPLLNVTRPASPPAVRSVSILTVPVTVVAPPISTRPPSLCRFAPSWTDAPWMNSSSDPTSIAAFRVTLSAAVRIAPYG